jgi:hypothetical protein
MSCVAILYGVYLGVSKLHHGLEESIEEVLYRLLRTLVLYLSVSRILTTGCQNDSLIDAPHKGRSMPTSHNILSLPQKKLSPSAYLTS